MVRPTLSAIILVLGAAFASVAAAQTPPPMTFCFNNWAPYTVADDTGMRGISIDVMREAAQRAGRTATFEALPWNRCLEMVRQGHYDAVLDAAERDEFLQGPTSYNGYSYTFWVREDSALTALAFPALRGRRIGMIDGYKYPEALNRDIAAAEMQVDFSVDDTTAIRKLAFGRVDIVIGDYVGTLLFARQHDLKIRNLKPTHSSIRLYPSFNLERAGLQRTVDSALAAMVADGTIERIYQNHIGVGPDAAPGR